MLPSRDPAKGPRTEVVQYISSSTSLYSASSALRAAKSRSPGADAFPLASSSEGDYRSSRIHT